jgi:hypothetical protein
MSGRPEAGGIGDRAAVDRGETGDKIPGFDPAAAPMETDSEAGGAPSCNSAPAPSGVAHRPPQTSTGSAMRAMPGFETPGGHRVWWVVVTVLVVIAAGVFAAVAFA